MNNNNAGQQPQLTPEQQLQQRQLQLQQQMHQRSQLLAAAMAGGAGGIVRPNPLSTFLPGQQIPGQPQRQHQLQQASSLIPAPAPLGSSISAIQHLPMPTYLGANAAAGSSASPGGAGLVPSANSPFQRLNEQNGTAGGPPSSVALFPHLQWNTSRSPSNGPAPAPAPATTTPTPATSAPNRGAAAPTHVVPSSQASGSSLSETSHQPAANPEVVAVKREAEQEVIPSASASAAAQAPASTARPVPNDTRTSSSKSAGRPALPADGKGSAPTRSPIPYHPPCLPASVEAKKCATKELDQHFPNAAVITEPLPSFDGLFIVASKLSHYKISQFNPFKYAEVDQSDAFWMPKAVVPAEAVKVWRDGRVERIRMKEEYLQGGSPKETEETKRLKSLVEYHKRAASETEDSSAAPSSKRQKIKPPSATPEPQAKKLPDPAPATFSAPPAETEPVKKRGRPIGSKNKTSRNPSDFLRHVISQNGPQEVDEEDELVDEAPDSSADTSALQRPAITKARREEMEQEALVAKLLQARTQPIVNSPLHPVEPFLEIPAAKSPRYPTVVQRALAATAPSSEAPAREEPVSPTPPSQPVVPRQQTATRGRPRKYGRRMEEEAPGDSSDSRPSPAPAASSSRPTRARAGPASRVRAVTETEFKGLLGPRTGSSLEPTPPPATSVNGRSLRSNAQAKGARDDSEDVGPARERDASSPVEEFLSQPQAIISAEELARRAVPRVGGWIVPMAPPRAAATSSRAVNSLQIASSPPVAGQAEARKPQLPSKFAVVVPVRPGPPQGDFGREEQLADAYARLRDQHANTATIRTPQDLANALQDTGLLPQGKPAKAAVGPAPAALPPAPTTRATAPPAPVAATPTTQAGPSTQARVGPPPAPRPSKPLAVADLELRIQRSPAIPSFLKPEIMQLLATLHLSTDLTRPGAYVSDIDLMRIPTLASKACWWLDLDLGKLQEGGNGYTVILNLEIGDRSLTTHGMSRALVKQLHLVPSISPWYDNHGRRRTDDGRIVPDDNRTDGEVQTETLQDAQSIAVVEYQAELVSLKRELSKAKADLEAEEASKREVEEQSAFRQQQYNQASTRAVELSREVNGLEEQVSTLKRQLSDGLAAHRLFVNTAAERYQAEINGLRTENKLLRGQARSTDDDVRRRAAEYDTLRAVDIVRSREREKAALTAAGSRPSQQAGPSKEIFRPSTPQPPPPDWASSSALQMQQSAPTSDGPLNLPAAPAQRFQALTPPSVAAGVSLPIANGSAMPALLEQDSQAALADGPAAPLRGTQSTISEMDISGDVDMA
ncbi:hypothetical protein OC834_005965 [Tilletia horrida]|nr:hypothetical protein OC834_005965 [Tilletia horrida]